MLISITEIDFCCLQTADRANEMTLGSGAIAGNAFGVDRKLLSSLLQFPRVTMNSMDATMDRDFVIDFLYWASTTMLHLSRYVSTLMYVNYEIEVIGCVRTWLLGW